MAKMDLIDVLELAKNFAVVAGWGFFKLRSVNFNDMTGNWKLVADVGAIKSENIEFTIKDSDRKVIAYGDWRKTDSK